MTSKEPDKLPAPWLRDRDLEEIGREVSWLSKMRKFEADAIAAGMNIRPKQGKDDAGKGTV